MSVGYLISIGVAGVATWFALAPLPRGGLLGSISYRVGLAFNEVPLVLFYWWILFPTLLALVQGDIATPSGWAVLGVALLVTIGLSVVVARGLRTPQVVDEALDRGLGPGWRDEVLDELSSRIRRGIPWLRIVTFPLFVVLVLPFFVRRADVKRIKNISYGDAGRRNRLDVYRHRSAPVGGPILVYWHGGGYYSGRKSKEARPLLYRLASQGWVCVSANYRLMPEAGFTDHMVDAKKVIAWAREHGPEYGGDPSQIFVSGSSAGGHMASISALTPNEAAFQPGFEKADTSVTAAICLYGYYGHYYGMSPHATPPSSPMAYDASDAPPFFITHGDLDTWVPVEQARALTAKLRSESANAVVYAELPGGHHAFDLFRSPRTDAVVNGIEAFTAWVRSRQTQDA